MFFIRCFFNIRADCKYIGDPGEYHGYTVDGVTMTEPVAADVFHPLLLYIRADCEYIGGPGEYHGYTVDGVMPATVADGSFAYVSTPGYGEKYVSAKGQLTGVLAAVYGSAGGFLGGAFYYDERGRLIQSRSSNLLNGLETESVAYNFMGQPVKRLHVHSAPGKNSLSEVYTYTYDDTGLPLTTKHQLGSGVQTVLSDKVYDALGRLAREKRNGNANLLTGYSYNVRSWLTGITGGKFTQNLHYNTGTGTPCFNGNISSMTWKAGSESTVRGYRYTYDGLNRLTNAAYGETPSISSNANHFSEKVTGYDKNGNITALQRYGQTSASAYGLVDNLTFSLAGNQLNRVDDGAGSSAYGSSFEFKDAVKQADEYVYDANGNLMKDLNKGIAEIQYNFLNLPSLVTFADGSTIAYLYAADGTKLRTVHTIGGATTTTDYVGNVIYENGTQKLLLTEEGYVSLNDNQYHYYLKDHQGNNRVVINSAGTVEETNHYYPFGGVFASTSSFQPYKYNGKELDGKKGLNWYDYEARHYDAALGRFTTIDPLAEKYYLTSPYTYCLNNPIKNIDIDGRKIVDVNGNIIYSKDKGWIKNAPSDAVRIGNAMMQTRIGIIQFNKMVDASHDITLNISSESKIKRENNKTYYRLGTSEKHFAGDKLESVDITIYEGTLNKYLNANTPKAKTYKTSIRNNDEAIGIIAIHESVHATDEQNIKESKENIEKNTSHDVEKKPIEVEMNALRELFNKHNPL